MTTTNSANFDRNYFPLSIDYSAAIIDNVIDLYRDSIKGDLPKYRNHIYRVFHYCRLLDPDPANEKKYALAAVFHDIGIWTDETIDYLEPSIEQVKSFLTKSGKKEWIEEISLMIYWHHKPGGYTGNYEATVENFRKGDWIDVSLGFRRFGLSRKQVKMIKRKFPNLGFHAFLLRKLIRNFLSHPLRPLPMFKL